MSDHIVKAYDKELEILGRKIAEMGGIAEKMLSDAMDALTEFDTRLAQTTVDTDPRLDLLQRDIEEQAILTIARRQPMAVDLREIIHGPYFRRSRTDWRPRQEHRQTLDEGPLGDPHTARHHRAQVDA